jgi:hypothetical protein
MKCNLVLPVLLEMVMNIIDYGTNHFKALSYNCPGRTNESDKLPQFIQFPVQGSNL